MASRKKVRRKGRCVRCHARIWFNPTATGNPRPGLRRLCRDCQNGDGVTCASWYHPSVDAGVPC